MPSSSPAEPLTRRNLFRKAAVLAMPMIAIGSRPARGDCEPVETMVVWRLVSDWGYPRGPHGKTALWSRASRNAARHRFALSERDALDMNLHLCSFAPATAVVVRRDEFMSLWNDLAYRWTNPWLGRSVWVLDDRHVTRVADGPGRLGRALQPLPPGGSCPPTTDSDNGGEDSDNVASGVLPFTGFGGLSVPAVGTGLLLAGMVGIRRARGVVPRTPRAGSGSHRKSRGRHLRRRTSRPVG